MPVGVRAGMAAMSQIDRSLDEASLTLRGARGVTTLRHVVLPLLRPAIVARLVYSFVRAMTTVSAVIFLVTAEYDWRHDLHHQPRRSTATTASPSPTARVLIVLMLVVIG